MKKPRITSSAALIMLAIWFIASEAIYYLCINLYFEEIVLIYIGAFSLAAILFLLVNGGVRPLIKDDKAKEERVHTRYLLDKRNENKNKRKNRRDRFKRYTVTQSEEEASVVEEIPRFNPFKLSDEDRVFYTKALLIFGVPLLLTVFVDYILLMLDIKF